MNAAASFICGLMFFALAAAANAYEVNIVVIWAFVVIGLVFAVPVAWFQLFEERGTK